MPFSLGRVAQVDELTVRQALRVGTEWSIRETSDGSALALFSSEDAATPVVTFGVADDALTRQEIEDILSNFSSEIDASLQQVSASVASLTPAVYHGADTGITFWKKAASEYEIDYSAYPGGDLIDSHALVNTTVVTPVPFNVLQNFHIVHRLYPDTKKIIVFTTLGNSFDGTFGFSLSVTSSTNGKLCFYVLVDGGGVMQKVVSLVH